MRRPGPRIALFDQLRAHLASADALPQMAALGIVSGLLTGILVLLFRGYVQVPLELMLPLNKSENFEDVPILARIAMAGGGALVLGALLHRLRPRDQVVGVAHVLERLHRHQGHLPLRNALVQFFAGGAALISGQSGGREGPAIHLGAAISSLVGQYFALPNNSIRLLVGCGAAAAIAGSFNTPLAGVVFAMEVVMMEYTASSFIPIMLASAAATLLCQAAFGDHTAFDVPDNIRMQSLAEIPFVGLEGIVVAVCAAAFIQIIKRSRSLPIPALWQRIAIAGAITAAVAIVIPEVMGIGYDTVERTLENRIGLGALLWFTSAKLLVSGTTIGLRVPVGLIGPTLVIGAGVGGILGKLGALALSADGSADTSLYVMLGMAAMMGAVLQAPLAALLAVVELTGNPNTTLAAMIAIVVATVTVRVVFKQQSVFLDGLAAQGVNYPADPVALHLQRLGVSTVMEHRLAQLPPVTHPDAAEAALIEHPVWIIVEQTGATRYLLDATDLRRYLAVNHREDGDADTIKTLNLLDVPGRRLDLADIDLQATIHEAWSMLVKHDVQALCVRRALQTTNTQDKHALAVGVVTRDDILRAAGF